MDLAWLRLPLALSWTLALSLLLPVHGATAADAPDSRPTKVVVLGVDHSVQLVSEADRPGLLAAFIERVAPDAARHRVHACRQRQNSLELFPEHVVRHNDGIAISRITPH